jgi:hypothetical protein
MTEVLGDDSAVGLRDDGAFGLIDDRAFGLRMTVQLDQGMKERFD